MNRRIPRLAALLVALPVVLFSASVPSAVARPAHAAPVAPHLPLTDVPFARSQSGLAYDEVRNATVMFVGEYIGAYMNDTWRWDGTKWKLLAPRRSPSARAGMGMAFDAATGQIVMFGGFTGQVYLNDTWVWTGRAWRSMRVATRASPRANMGMT